MTTARKTTGDGVTTYEHTFALPASASKAYAAMTDARELTAWFAEHAKVELRVGGVFKFWGRHTPWMTEERHADQHLTRVEPGRSIAFAFTWRNCPSTASLTLESKGANACAVTIIATIGGDRLGLGDESKWYLGDFWRFSVGNLRNYLRTGKPALRPDFTKRGAGVDLSIYVEATPETVWAALTDPKQMDKWISTAAISEPRAGGAYSYGWQVPWGEEAPTHCGPKKIIDAVPARLLVTDWSFRNEQPSQVRWELTPEGTGTRVRIVHHRPDIDPELMGYYQGWSQFLVALMEFARDGVTERVM